jgi:endonuclease YncB( thermonuclease family)
VAYEDIIPIRLVHIDAPEAGSECYGDEAELELAGLLLEGMPVSIVTDPNLPEEDADGILQAWVWNSEFLVNLEMVKRGAATPYFPKGTRGAFDQRLLNAARKAKAAGRGLWGACSGTYSWEAIDREHPGCAGCSHPVPDHALLSVEVIS